MVKPFCDAEEAEMTMSDPAAIEHRDGQVEVLIAGGGVAGLEAAFALQRFAADRVRVRVISVGSDFDYRPLSVGEPFNRSHMTRFELEPLVHAAGAELVHDALVSVEPKTRCAHLASGSELHYDALLVATGAYLDPIFPHATTVDPERMDELLHGLVQDVEEGYLHRLAVVIPAPPPWPMPAYEIALMAAERAWDMQTSLDVTLITPEAAPLQVFGEAVTRGLSALFDERRIKAITSAWCEMPQSRKLIVHPGGRELEFDRIVALPALRGPDLPGLPHDSGGFVPVDEYGHVRGVDRVWAAGDCTDQPIKMGAVAAGLADVAAESIAEMFGAHLHGRTFVPTIEGVLMTGGTPRYLRARPASPGEAGESVFETVAPGAQPPKIHARYLGPHLRQATERPVPSGR
jgi:sulfide:quinone oxidoreductase